MLLSRVSAYAFAVKKVITQPGIIVDPEAFKSSGFFSGLSHWMKNKQTFIDMERHLQDFKSSTYEQKLLNVNNGLIEHIEKGRFRDIEPIVTKQYYRQLKETIKEKRPLSENLNLFRADKVKIVQARSFVDQIVRLKSIDQWYQLTIEYENVDKRKGYHVLQRFYKGHQWQFIKFNL